MQRVWAVNLGIRDNKPRSSPHIVNSSRKVRNARKEFIGLRRIPGEGKGGVEEVVNHGLSRKGFANARHFWGCASVSAARPCRSVVELAIKKLCVSASLLSLR